MPSLTPSTSTLKSSSSNVSPRYNATSSWDSSLFPVSVASATVSSVFAPPADISSAAASFISTALSPASRRPRALPYYFRLHQRRQRWPHQRQYCRRHSCTKRAALSYQRQRSFSHHTLLTYVPCVPALVSCLQPRQIFTQKFLVVPAAQIIAGNIQPLFDLQRRAPPAHTPTGKATMPPPYRASPATPVYAASDGI